MKLYFIIVCIMQGYIVQCLGMMSNCLLYMVSVYVGKALRAGAVRYLPSEYFNMDLLPGRISSVVEILLEH